MTYNPPTKVTTKQIPYLALVVTVDPMFERRKYHDVEYAFQGRTFYANPQKRGPYDRLGNVYPVGQPQGSPDPAITAALAPTVGNPVPGLYIGVPDGEGWA